MKKIGALILLGCTFTFVLSISSVAAFRPSLVAPVFADVLEENLGVPTLSSQESSQGILLAKKGKEKYNCLEVCAKTRYQCETGNRGKNKVGTKKNWQESGKCEKKYRTCLDKCEVD